MELKDSRQLGFYKKHFHKKGYDTINCPEYLTLIWVGYPPSGFPLITQKW